MLEAFKLHLNKNLPELLNARILVACSGGLDSMALTHLLMGSKIEIGLAHCNFSLRGEESDNDESFVVEQSEQLEIPVYTQTFETEIFASDQGLSTQMAARELRYSWFEEIRADFKYDYIVTAHHLDDSLETFFINLSRGTGIRGISGIPAVNGYVIRPLLPFSRKEIFEYAKNNGILWREDSSNAKIEYLRNQIRHEVIPPFKSSSKNWMESFQKTLSNLQDTANLLEDYLSIVMKLVVEEREEAYAIRIDKLTELPNYEALLYELLSDFGFTAWEDILNLISAQSGKQVFSKTHRLLKDREVILLTEKPKEKKKNVKLITKNDRQIDSPLKMSFIPSDKMGYIDNNTIYVDFERLKFPLTLRPWQEGDHFQPFGMKGNKKLSKFFKDEKLSLAAKEAIWTLLSDDKIVWIVGYRMDDRFKIRPNTNKILKIAVKD